MEQLKGAIESKIKGPIDSNATDFRMKSSSSYHAVTGSETFYPPYTGSIDISFTTYGSEARIRPAEFSTFWLRKIFPSNGGRWELVGSSAYPLKQWVPTTSQKAQGSTRCMETSTGGKELLGVKEGEWLKNWENVIERAVRESYQSPIPLNKGFTALAQVREHLIWMDITKPKASIEVNHIILVNSFDKTFLHLSMNPNVLHTVQIHCLFFIIKYITIKP